MKFSKQEYWSWLPFPTPGDLPNPGLNTCLLQWQADCLPLSHFSIQLDPCVGKIPWRGQWLPTPVFWPGEFHWWYSPWGCKELDMAEWLSLSFTFSLKFIPKYFSLRSDQIRSVTQSCLTLCDPMNCSTPGLPVHHQLPEFTQTHSHGVSDAIQLSHPLSSPSPPAPNPSQPLSLFQWVNSSHEVAKILEFQL